METNALLETYLRQLRLPTFLKNYPHFAKDAASNNQDFVRFLLALAEQEVNQRETNMLQKRRASLLEWDGVILSNPAWNRPSKLWSRPWILPDMRMIVMLKLLLKT